MNGSWNGSRWGFAAPAEWIGPGVVVDLWVPFVVDVAEQPRGDRSYSTVARLRAGVGIGEASAEMRAIADALRRSYPEANEDWQLRVIAWRAPSGAVWSYGSSGARCGSPWLRE